MNQDIYNIYENYKQIYVLEEGSMLDKIKAVIAASVILASGLQADDNRARMVTDKIKNTSASELSQQYPRTVQTVQQSSVLKNTNKTISKQELMQSGDVFSVWMGLVLSVMEANPESVKEAQKIGKQYQEEQKIEIPSQNGTNK